MHQYGPTRVLHQNFPEKQENIRSNVSLTQG